MRHILRAVSLWCALVAGHAHAHELTPAIADLIVEGETAALQITLNLEAVVARVGPDHDSTVGTPAEALYNTLRALPPNDLSARYAADGPDVTGLISVTDGNTRLPLSGEAPKIPPVGDIDLPRESTLTFAIPLEGATTAQFAWDESLGPIVLRVTKADGTAGFAGYLSDGAESPPFDLIGEPPSLWQRLFGR